MLGFAEQVIGMEKGEEKEFTLSYPPDFSVEELAGKQRNFKVKLVEVKGKRLPLPDDEFAKSIGEGLETMDALQDRITTNLTVIAQRRAQREFEQKVVESVAALAKVEFPPILVEHEIENLLAELASEYSQDERGVENYLSSIGKTEAELREEIRPLAIKRLIQSLVLGRVAEEEKIELSPTEIEAGIEEVVQNAGKKSEEWRRIFSSPPGRRWIEQRLLRRKTVDRIVEIAQSSASEENGEFLERRVDENLT
jgi:trigger factor